MWNKTVLLDYSGWTIAHTKALQHDYSFCIFEFTLIFREPLLICIVFYFLFFLIPVILFPAADCWAKYKPDCSDGSHTARRLLSQERFSQNRNKLNCIKTFLIPSYIFPDRQSLSRWPVSLTDTCNSSAVKVVQQTHVKSPHLRPGEIEHVIAHCLSQKLIGRALRVCLCVRERKHAEWAHKLILCVCAAFDQISLFRGAFLGGWMLHFLEWVKPVGLIVFSTVGFTLYLPQGCVVDVTLLRFIIVTQRGDHVVSNVRFCCNLHPRNYQF